MFFRGLYRLWGKSKPGLAKAWMNGFGSAIINMQAGRQLPDGIRRRLMRGGNLRRHAAEVDLGLRNAFDHVDRYMLRTIAAKMGYPLAPLECSLPSYTRPRRLAIGKAVGPAVLLGRGIAAGSAWAVFGRS